MLTQKSSLGAVALSKQSYLVSDTYFGSSVSERFFNKQKTMQTKKLEDIVVSFLKIF